MTPESTVIIGAPSVSVDWAAVDCSLDALGEFGVIRIRERFNDAAEVRGAES